MEGPKPKPREFLGTYACMACGCRVRVYDWLPSQVLCAKCSKKEHENNSPDWAEDPPFDWDTWKDPMKEEE